MDTKLPGSSMARKPGLMAGLMGLIMSGTVATPRQAYEYTNRERDGRRDPENRNRRRAQKASRKANRRRR